MNHLKNEKRFVSTLTKHKPFPNGGENQKKAHANYLRCYPG